MMKKIFRAGIIGCGKIASDFADDPKMMGDIFTHAEAYSRNEDTILTAICDTAPDQLEKCGNRWRVPSRYLEITEMIQNEDLDIVSVCTPDTTHYQVIMDILSNPGSVRVILCEKPLATSVQTAEEILEKTKENNVILAVMYMRRYANNFQVLKDFISAGEIGRVQAVSGWYTKGVRHNGTHWFDILRFLVGEVAWVRAWNQLVDHLEDPTLDVVMGVENGCIATLRACDPTTFTVFEMDILGTQGRVRILDSGFEMEHSTVMDSSRYSGYKELNLSPVDFGDRKNLMLHAVEDVVSALKTGKAVKCSGEDGVAVLKIADAAVESARLDTTVQLNQ